MMRRIATIGGCRGFVVLFREGSSLIRNHVQMLMEITPSTGWCYFWYRGGVIRVILAMLPKPF